MNLVKRLVKISDKKFCKKILGLGHCDKTAPENDFRVLFTTVFHNVERSGHSDYLRPNLFVSLKFSAPSDIEP